MERLPVIGLAYDGIYEARNYNRIGRIRPSAWRAREKSAWMQVNGANSA
jgi:hypothetical protein